MGKVILGFFAMTLLEIWVLVQSTQAFGGLTTFVAILALSTVGAWVVKYEGTNAFREVTNGLATGSPPTEQIVNGLLILTSGIMLLTPGFVTAGVGLVLAIRPIRKIVAQPLQVRLSTYVSDKAKSSVVFGMGTPGGNAQSPFSGFGGSGGFGGTSTFGSGFSTGDIFAEGQARARHGDFIDLDPNEAYFDDAEGELEQ